MVGRKEAVSMELGMGSMCGKEERSKVREGEDGNGKCIFVD